MSDNLADSEAMSANDPEVMDLKTNKNIEPVKSNIVSASVSMTMDKEDENAGIGSVG